LLTEEAQHFAKLATAALGSDTVEPGTEAQAIVGQ
jgi:hypothetical protein